MQFNINDDSVNELCQSVSTDETINFDGPEWTRELTLIPQNGDTLSVDVTGIEEDGITRDDELGDVLMTRSHTSNPPWGVGTTTLQSSIGVYSLTLRIELLNADY